MKTATLTRHIARTKKHTARLARSIFHEADRLIDKALPAYRVDLRAERDTRPTGKALTELARIKCHSARLVLAAGGVRFGDGELFRFARLRPRRIE